MRPIHDWLCPCQTSFGGPKGPPRARQREVWSHSFHPTLVLNSTCLTLSSSNLLNKVKQTELHKRFYLNVQDPLGASKGGLTNSRLVMSESQFSSDTCIELNMSNYVCFKFIK